MQKTDEKDTVQKILSGDSHAFAELVDRYKKPVFNLCFRMTGSRENAEDLAQETFLRAYQFLYRFDREKAFYPWLVTICLNVIRNHRRKRKLLLRFIPFSDNHPSSDDPEGALQDKQQAKSVQAMLQKVNPKYREALVLRYYQEWTFPEMSAVLKISESAAKMRVFRGLKKMKQLLQSVGKP